MAKIKKSKGIGIAVFVLIKIEMPFFNKNNHILNAILYFFLY